MKEEAEKTPYKEGQIKNLRYKESKIAKINLFDASGGPIKSLAGISRLYQVGIEQVQAPWLYHKPWKGSLRGRWLHQDHWNDLQPW